MVKFVLYYECERKKQQIYFYIFKFQKLKKCYNDVIVRRIQTIRHDNTQYKIEELKLLLLLLFVEEEVEVEVVEVDKSETKKFGNSEFFP